MLPEPMVVCSYGWGRWLRLYPDQIDIDGIFYALRNIIQVRPHYRHVLGIASVRLEIHFLESIQVLRGMPLLPETQVLVEYLIRWAVANSQRNEKLRLMGQSPYLKETPLPPLGSAVLPGFRECQTVAFKRQASANVGVPRLEIPHWMLLRKEQRERRLQRLQIERSLREHGFDVAGLARRLEEGELPHVQVPIRLLPGEHAHYCTEATLCEEPLAIHPRYIIKDQGSLIFTNKRVIYLGRKSQLVISYARLLHVSHLQGALAFLAEHWSKREVFEVPRPLEGTMYLEAILKRYQPELPGPHATQARVYDPRAHEAFVAPSTTATITPPRAIEDEDTQPMSVVLPVGKGGAVEKGMAYRSRYQRTNWTTENIAQSSRPGENL